MMYQPMIADRKTIGMRVAAIRENRGLTRRDLADMTGLTWKTVYHVEYGTYMPGTMTLGLICIALGISMDKLIGLQPAPPVVEEMVFASGGVS